MNFHISSLETLRIIFVFSFIQELVFWCWKIDIFDWNAETGSMHLKHIIEKRGKIKKNKEDKFDIGYECADRKETYKCAPPAWKIYRFIIELVGIFIGWVLLLFVYNGIVAIEASRFKDIGGAWALVFALIVGLVGIFGRLPVIIDSVQSWFKRP